MGWTEVLKRDPQFVVFGELHGTREAPSFVADLLCAEARRGQRLLLAVEHPAWHNAAWQEAWAQPAAVFEKSLADLGWRNRDDGVASEAMLQLVLAAHALKERGAAIDIVAFSGARDDAQQSRLSDLPGQGPHEAAQADNIAEAAARKDYDRVLVLVGNLHAEIAPLDFGGAQFEPMAMRLHRYGSVLSLGVQHAGGKSWSCRLPKETKLEPGQRVTKDMIVCAAFPAPADAAQRDASPAIVIGDMADIRLAGRFDGTFWIGAISASPPAFPAGE